MIFLILYLAVLHLLHLCRWYLPCFSWQWRIQLEQKINLELIQLKTWFNSNKLTMNIKKTAGVLTQPTIKLKSFQFNISLCNEQIPLVKSYKYLGIHLNQGCANCGPRPEIVRPAKGCGSWIECGPRLVNVSHVFLRCLIKSMLQIERFIWTK